jgi:hypothetical protein
MITIFEREARKEKNLENAARLAAQKKPVKKEGDKEAKKAENAAAFLEQVEAKFFSAVAEEGEDVEAMKSKAAVNNKNNSVEEVQAPAQQQQQPTEIAATKKPEESPVKQPEESPAK